MKNKKYYVSESKIHGRGLFASELIKKGETIGIVEGKKTTVNGDYVLWVSDKTGIRVKCDLRFINHADKPNACYFDTLDVAAIKDIKPGEEITHNYEAG